MRRQYQCICKRLDLQQRALNPRNHPSSNLITCRTHDLQESTVDQRHFKEIQRRKALQLLQVATLCDSRVMGERLLNPRVQARRRLRRDHMTPSSIDRPHRRSQFRSGCGRQSCVLPLMQINDQFTAKLVANLLRPWVHRVLSGLKPERPLEPATSQARKQMATLQRRLCPVSHHRIPYLPSILRRIR